MKRISATILSFLLLASAVHAQQNAVAQTSPAAQPNLSLTIDISKVSYPVEKIIFTYYNTTTKFRFTDSALPGAEKKVEFTTHIDEPILAQIRAITPDDPTNPTHKNHYARDSYSIYIEPGKLTATAIDSLSNTTVKGSSTHQTYLALKALEKPYQAQFDALYQSYGEARKNKDATAADKAEKQIDSLENIEKEKVYKPFVIAQGKKSPVALYALSQYTGYAIDPVKAQALYDQLGANIKDLPAGHAFAERIRIARTLQVGQPALAFTQNDTLDQPVSLANFKGKYVLLDFWASWCGPCRAENPNVVKAYNKYKDKGFTVLGVSLDRPGQKEKWLKAIHDDRLTWTQVSDLKFWDNDVAKLYDIKAIPQNFLIDTEGRIVARNVQGETLEATLEQLIK